MERMNTEGSSNKSSSAGPATPTNSRKERGAIAAQACESCRARKQKCSEERPKCSTCQRMNLDCKYREPQPTKKDKTLVEILDRLKNLEGGLREIDGKVEKIHVRGALPASIYALHSQTSSHPPMDTARSSSWPSSNVHMGGSASTASPLREIQYVSATHKMLGWPFIQQLLHSTSRKDPQLDLTTLDKTGVAAMLGSQGRTMSLPSNPFVSPLGEDQSAVTGGIPSAREIDGVQDNALDVDWDTMQQLTKAYFNTFNLMYPIMDRQIFLSEVLPAVANHGFDDVFALGQVAIDGMQGDPVATYKGRPSGVRGGTTDRPPGLVFFNEARKRMGFNLTECSLENVQMFSLAALYYEACFHHAEFWRMTVSASLACQALLTSTPEELGTNRGDLIRRAFWHCSIMETYVLTPFCHGSLEKLEELVGLPDFSGSFTEDDYIGNQASHFQEHFASQIVLRRLSVEFHTTLINAFTSDPLNLTSVSHIETPTTSATTTTKQLASQLDQWRGLLPVYLRWSEDQPGAFSQPPELFEQSMYPTPVMDVHTGFMFTTDLNTQPVSYPYAVDIQTANLRTRYYYVKYLMYRPFVFKALHHPDQMTHNDAEAVAECLKAILKWPIIMSPICFQKRLVPCSFFWSQNLLGILIILHLTQEVPILMRIRTTLTGGRFERDAEETIMLCIDWMRDLKDVDEAAMRCWRILKGFYPLEDDI
ncbi:hypothetical protein F5Y15DRAFT_427096 [Xylariaceae sp. FL0016]|nr:hypothetical protein F5Y15DRAFT_427096 [Xylariaceae sp. FL0016]